MKNKTKVYSPRSALIEPIELIQELGQDLIGSRELAWRLLLRNLNAQYRQTVFGALWIAIPPLAAIATFLSLGASKVLTTIQSPDDYRIYVIIGVIVWQSFTDAINGPLKMFESSKVMLAKLNFPREALVLAAIGEAILISQVRSIILISILILLDAKIAHTAVLFPLFQGALTLIGIVIGTIIAPVGILFQDVGRAMPLLTSFWMLISPVVYVIPKESLLGNFNRFNPVSPLIDACRDVLIVGSIGSLLTVSLIAGMAILFGIGGWIVFRIALPHLASRLES